MIKQRCKMAFCNLKLAKKKSNGKFTNELHLLIVNTYLFDLYHVGKRAASALTRPGAGALHHRHVPVEIRYSITNTTLSCSQLRLNNIPPSCFVIGASLLCINYSSTCNF